jgi:hypothetical protein
MYHCAWPEVAWLPDVTPKGVPLEGCAHAQSEVVEYPPFWGLFTESDVIKHHVTPQGIPWKCARMRNRKLRNIRPSGAFSPKVTSSNVTRRASPGTGSHVIGSALGVLSRTSASMIVYELTLSLVICPFPAILFSWGAPSIITFLTKVCCFRICCVVLQAVQGVSAFSLWYL